MHYLATHQNPNIPFYASSFFLDQFDSSDSIYNEASSVNEKPNLSNLMDSNPRAPYPSTSILARYRGGLLSSPVSRRCELQLTVQAQQWRHQPKKVGGPNNFSLLVISKMLQIYMHGTPLYKTLFNGIAQIPGGV